MRNLEKILKSEYEMSHMIQFQIKNTQDEKEKQHLNEILEAITRGIERLEKEKKYEKNKNDFKKSELV